ncbi:MAG: lysylphosphatidylglycerol synthase transmembrane domain-containing protein [Candidatus Bathyarchaeia archaeon]
MAESPKWALLTQALLGAAIIFGVVWYIGAQNLGRVFASIDFRYLLLSSLAYLGMNALFAVRLRRVLKALGYSAKSHKLLLIQYGGMLASDVTPARSGYFAVPVMLASEKIPITVGLSSILGIQSIEFFVKMLGGSLALIYLLSAVSLGSDVFVVSLMGIALMFVGGVVLAAAVWSRKAARLIEGINKVPLIGRFARILFGKIAEFQQEGARIKSVAADILVLTVLSWFLKAVEWYYIGMALSIDQIPFIGYFLLHPLITALSFVPLTPSGIGFQEGAAIGALFLLGVETNLGLAFALMARIIVTIQDLIGAYAISRTGVKIFEAVSTIRER